MEQRAGHARRVDTAHGQSLIELALLLSLVCLLLLAVVDLAHAYSAQQRLEQATHLVTLRLLSTPTLSLADARGGRTR